MNARSLRIESDIPSGSHSEKQPLSGLLRTLLCAVGICLYHLGLAQALIRLSPQRVRTLLYHAIEEQPGSYTAGLDISITPSTFSRHLDYLQTHYNVISLEDLIRGRQPPCSAVVTFDGGYRSVAEHAVSALEQRKMPATVYVIGRAVMGGMVWMNQLNHALNRHPRLTMSLLAEFPGLSDLEPEQVIRRVRTHYPPMMIEYLISRLEAVLPADNRGESLFLTPEQIRTLQRRGISFGFHSNDHYNLPLCNELALRQQLDSRDIDHLLDSRTFAYPFGCCGEREADRLEARGFQRTMLVQQETPNPRKTNLNRSKPRGRSAAAVFAQMEVEEPIMRWLGRRLNATAHVD